MRFPGLRRPLLSGRRTPRAIPALPWRRQRRFTIICGCCLRVADKRFASSAAWRCGATIRRKSPTRFCCLRPVGVSMCFTSFASRRRRPPERAGAEEEARTAFARSFAQRAQRHPEARVQSAVSGRRLHEFSSPETLLDVDFTRRFTSGGPAGCQSGVAARLVDSIEICYREAGGEAILEFVADGRKSGRASCFQRAVRMQERRHAVPRAGAAAVFLQQSIRRLPALPGFRQHIDFDLNLVVPDPSKSLDEGAVEPWTKPRYKPCFKS